MEQYTSFMRRPLYFGSTEWVVRDNALLQSIEDAAHDEFYRAFAAAGKKPAPTLAADSGRLMASCAASIAGARNPPDRLPLATLSAAHARPATTSAAKVAPRAMHDLVSAYVCVTDPELNMAALDLRQVSVFGRRDEHPWRLSMSIIRMIHTTFPAAMSAQAERNWKEKCAPLMIQQHGCLSERLLRCGDVPGEYISYSEWDSEESIRAYLRTEAHREIKRLNTNIQGAHVVVKMYEEVS